MKDKATPLVAALSLTTLGLWFWLVNETRAYELPAQLDFTLYAIAWAVACLLAGLKLGAGLFSVPAAVLGAIVAIGVLHTVGLAPRLYPPPDGQYALLLLELLLAQCVLFGLGRIGSRVASRLSNSPRPS